MFDNLLAALAFGLVNTVIDGTAKAVRADLDFKDWEWEMLTTPVNQ